jgi:hypothetical protein
MQDLPSAIMRYFLYPEREAARLLGNDNSSIDKLMSSILKQYHRCLISKSRGCGSFGKRLQIIPDDAEK